MKRASLLLLAILLSSPAAAAPYALDAAASKLSFSGKHAGKDFTGSFKSWNATIDFDAQQTETSHITASFDTASAHTGNAMYDGTLPSPDWFNTKEFPKAEFTSSSITADGKGGYLASGTLTIRGIAQKVSFPFSLNEAGDKVKASFSLILNRMDFDIGKKSDPSAEWVDKDIRITAEIMATPKK